MKEKQTLYDIIGDVNPTSSPNDIKKKFRRKASQIHPDKGGSHDDMAKLNHAYDVLSDPQRKLLYDNTGNEEADSTDKRLNSLVREAFIDGLNKNAPNLLIHARTFVQNIKDNREKNKQEAIKFQEKLRKRRGKIKTKLQVNIVHDIIDQHIYDLNKQIASFDADLEIAAKAEEVLSQYESDEDIVFDPLDPFEVLKSLREKRGQSLGDIFGELYEPPGR